MSSTTISSQTPTDGRGACYVSFGRAMGYMGISADTNLSTIKMIIYD